MRIAKEKLNWKSIKESEKEDKLYRLHHMHHFLKNKKVTHEIHHCFVFGEKQMRGEKFEVYHFVSGKDVFHCLRLNKKDAMPPAVVYDHADRKYKITPLTIYGKQVYKVI